MSMLTVEIVSRRGLTCAEIAGATVNPGQADVRRDQCRADTALAQSRGWSRTPDRQAAVPLLADRIVRHLRSPS